MAAERRPPMGVVHLAPVDERNRAPCLALRLAPGQVGWVASNEKSLLQASQNPKLVPRVVLEGPDVVGLVMYERRDADTAYVWRILIGADRQGRGLGRRALELLLEELRAEGRRTVLISHRPGNGAAAHLFTSLGFQKFEVEADGEIMMRMGIAASAP